VPPRVHVFMLPQNGLYLDPLGSSAFSKTASVTVAFATKSSGADDVRAKTSDSATTILLPARKTNARHRSSSHVAGLSKLTFRLTVRAICSASSIVYVAAPAV